MKLIIDIPDEEYNRIKEWKDNITDYQTSLVLYRVVRNGIPYEERPQGEWKSEGGFVFCNQCGSSHGVHKTNFCPNCGAKLGKGGAE